MIFGDRGAWSALGRLDDRPPRGPIVATPNRNVPLRAPILNRYSLHTYSRPFSRTLSVHAVRGRIGQWEYGKPRDLSTNLIKRSDMPRAKREV